MVEQRTRRIVPLKSARRRLLRATKAKLWGRTGRTLNVYSNGLFVDKREESRCRSLNLENDSPLDTTQLGVDHGGAWTPTQMCSKLQTSSW